MDIQFTKMHGSGNDFILVDEWDGKTVPEKDEEAFVALVSDRHFGIGSDGVIFVQKSVEEDAKFHFYNPDGSIAEMCGNGIRCFAKYVYEKGYVKKEVFTAETLAGVKILELTVDSKKVLEVKVAMGAPQISRGKAQVAQGDLDSPMIDEKLVIEGNEYKVTAVGMGNPHAIMFVEDVEDADVEGDGPLIRNSREVFPNGVNVHFIHEEGVNEFNIRTYERGVEGETLACGTGICASAVACILNDKADMKKPLLFHARGGDLKIELAGTPDNIENIFLIGPAEEAFTGTCQYNIK